MEIVHKKLSASRTSLAHFSYSFFPCFPCPPLFFLSFSFPFSWLSKCILLLATCCHHGLSLVFVYSFHSSVSVWCYLLATAICIVNIWHTILVCHVYWWPLRGHRLSKQNWILSYFAGTKTWAVPINDLWVLCRRNLYDYIVSYAARFFFF